MEESSHTKKMLLLLLYNQRIFHACMDNWTQTANIVRFRLGDVREYTDAVHGSLRASLTWKAGMPPTPGSSPLYPEQYREAPNTAPNCRSPGPCVIRQCHVSSASGIENGKCLPDAHTSNARYLFMKIYLAVLCCPSNLTTPEHEWPIRGIVAGMHQHCCT